MTEDKRRHLVTVEVDPEIKRWLERKTAERLIEGRPHGERSISAVVRDLILDAAKSETGPIASAAA